VNNETLAQFLQRTGLKAEVRFAGQPFESLAILPFPDAERPAAFRLSDYFVSASVSGPCLEFQPRSL
jgi:hypothetical protein